MSIKSLKEWSVLLESRKPLICPKNERSWSCQKICKQLRTETNTFYGIEGTAVKSSSWAAKWHQQETQTSILGTCNQNPDRETFAVNCHSALTRLQRQQRGGGQMILLEYWPVKWKYLIRISSMVWKEDIFQNNIIIMQDNTPSHAAQKRLLGCYGNKRRKKFMVWHHPLT